MYIPVETIFHVLHAYKDLTTWTALQHGDYQLAH